MERSRGWLLLPIALAAAVWFGWTRERSGAGRAGAAGDSVTGTSAVASELARPEDRDESAAASASGRVPAQETKPGAHPEPFSVRLRVLEQAGRLPIPGAIVQAFEREFETDAQGACEIPWPEARGRPGFHFA